MGRRRGVWVVSVDASDGRIGGRMDKIGNRERPEQGLDELGGWRRWWWFWELGGERGELS